MKALKLNYTKIFLGDIRPVNSKSKVLPTKEVYCSSSTSTKMFLVIFSLMDSRCSVNYRFLLF